MNALISRSFADAFFAIKKGSWQSVFFEGGASRVAPRFMEDIGFQPTMSMFSEYDPSYWSSISEDCEELRQEISNFLSVNVQQDITKDGALPDNPEESSLKRLSRYATENWQLTSANIELTYRCNFRCKFCYLSDYKQEEMSLPELEKLGRALRESGVIFTSFTGGEVFMRPDALDVLSLFSNLGFALELKTNGALLDDGKIDILTGLPIFDIQVSIYDLLDGASTSTQRQYPFEKIAENICNIHGCGIPITLSVLVGKHNVDDLDNVHAVLKGIADVPVYYTPYITPRRSGVDEGIKYRLSTDELRSKFAPFLQRINGLVSQERYRDCETCTNTCYAGRDQVAVDPFGNISPCLDLPERIGNMKNGNLNEILSADSRRRAMEKFLMKDMAQCLACDIREYCDSCVGVAMVENDDHTRPASHKCDIVRFYVESQSLERSVYP